MEDREKVKFIEKELTALVKKICPDIKKLKYSHTKPHNEEYCTINFSNNQKIRVCITADSLSAITIDVLRACV